MIPAPVGSRDELYADWRLSCRYRNVGDILGVFGGVTELKSALSRALKSVDWYAKECQASLYGRRRQQRAMPHRGFIPD